MALLYQDAVRDEIIGAAARLTVQNYARQHQATLREIAESAVRETFCTCVTGAEDIIEHHLSAIHAELIDDVLEQSQAVLEREQSLGTTAVNPAPTAAGSEQNKRWSVEEQLDGAEGDSFPASDPPSLTDPVRTIKADLTARRT